MSAIIIVNKTVIIYYKNAIQEKKDITYARVRNKKTLLLPLTLTYLAKVRQSKGNTGHFVRPRIREHVPIDLCIRKTIYRLLVCCK